MEFIGKSLDYLDLRVLRFQQNNLRLEDETTLILDGDILPYLIKESTGISFKKVSSKGRYILYKSDNEYLDDIFINVEKEASSIQFKSKFFLKENSMEIILKILEIAQRNEWAYHSTRTDFQYLLKADNIKQIIKNFDFLDLLISQKIKNKKLLYLRAENSNIDVVIYDKTNQIEEIASKEYKEDFMKKYGNLDNLFRIEFRIKNKRTNKNIMPSIKNKENFEELIKIEILKRVKIKKSLKRLIFK